MSNDTHPAASQVRRAYRQAESPLMDPNLANLVMEMLSARDLARVEIVSKGFQELVETITKKQSISFIGRVVERKPGESWATFLHFLMEMRRSPVSVAVGLHSLLVAPSTGELWSWGDGNSGQLGHGDTQDQPVPRRVEALAAERVVRVAAGSNHCVAVTSTGELWSWGKGYSGQLGHGDTQDQHAPRRVEALAAERVVQVAAGSDHCVAVTSTGELWAWGDGEEGQLGHGDTQDQLVPRRVEGLAAERVMHAAAGSNHTLVVTSTGALWAWGEGEDGQLGHGDTENELVPRRVEALAAERVVHAAAGNSHTLVVTSTGALWAWGYGYTGQLGHGDTQDQPVPRRVEALAAERVVDVAAGGIHTVAVTSTGALWSWGCGYSGQLGHGDTQELRVPARVETLKDHQICHHIQGFFEQFPPSKVLKMTGALLKEVGYELTKQGCMFTDQEIKASNPDFDPSHKKVANAMRAEVQVEALWHLVLVHLGYEEDADLDDFEEELRDMYASIKAVIENPELLELELEEPEEPLTVQSSMSITHVAAGGDRNMVVTSDSKIWAWGRGIGRLPRQVDQDHMRLSSGSGSGSGS